MKKVFVLGGFCVMFAFCYTSCTTSLDYIEQGRAYYEQGGYDQAIAAYTQAIDGYTSNIDNSRRQSKIVSSLPFYYYYRGDAYLYRGDAYDDIGDSNLANANYDRAIADYNQAIKTDLNYDLQQSQESQQTQERYQRAIANDDFEALRKLERERSNRTLSNSWGNAFGTNTRLNHANVYNDMGVACARKKDYNLAIAAYTLAIKTDSNHKWAYANRGSIYLITDNRNQAIADLNRALAIDQNYQWAKNKLQEAQGGTGN
jgi:tetratricopeptide (TPR) repeat protein